MLLALSNLSFRWKIALPILLLAVLLVLMGGLAMRGITQATDSSSRLTHRYLPAISLLLNADRDLYQAFLAERSLLDEDTGARVAELKASHAENLQQAWDRVHKYAALQPGDKAAQLLQAFERDFALWKASSEQVVQLSSANAQAASILSFGASQSQFNAMRGSVDKLGEIEDQAAKGEGDAALELDNSLAKQQGVILVIGLLICLVLIVVFPTLVTRPLHALLRRIEEIADGDGDLRIRLEVSSRDELGKLSLAFNRFLDKLQPMIKEVGRVTAEVADSARSLAGMAAVHDGLINNENAAVDQVSTAAAEMSAAVNEVARNAQSAAQAAHSAEDQSLASARVVAQTIEAMRQLAHEVENASGTIQTLAQETTNIGAVLAVIKGIAEQTNLLALNAAIEAARAGEQGRGFAVVADEVRALAARTQTSTKDIQQMIERLQAGAEVAVKAMSSGSAKAHDSLDRASGVDQILADSGSSVKRINDMAAQIATACEEQSAVTEEIARNISDIRDISNESALTSQKSTLASRHLSELSLVLAKLVGSFRV